MIKSTIKFWYLSTPLLKLLTGTLRPINSQKRFCNWILTKRNYCCHKSSNENPRVGFGSGSLGNCSKIEFRQKFGILFITFDIWVSFKIAFCFNKILKIAWNPLLWQKIRLHFWTQNDLKYMPCMQNILCESDFKVLCPKIHLLLLKFMCPKVLTWSYKNYRLGHVKITQKMN